jgi:putative transposase
LGEPRGLKEIAMSQDHNRLNHATWECKYHIVFTPKYPKKALFGQIRRPLGTMFRELARRKECQIEEGHLLPDHVHMLIAECGTQGAECSAPQIPGERYFVSTVGRTEENRPCHSQLDIGGPAEGFLGRGRSALRFWRRRNAGLCGRSGGRCRRLRCQGEV